MHKYKLFLFLYLALVSAYQLHHITDKSRDVDEFGSIMVGSGFLVTDINSLNDKTFNQNFFFKKDNLLGAYDATLLAEGGNCIFFSSTLHYWMLLTGKSIVGTRIFSLIFYLGSIILLFILGIKLFEDKAIAISSSILFGINPIVMHYGINTRCYMMATFLTLLSTYFFLTWKNELTKQEAGRKITKNAAFYALFASASILTHYFSAFVVFIHFLFLFPSIIKHNKKYLTSSIFIFTTVTIIIGSWLIGGGIEGYKGIQASNSFHKEYAHKQNKTLTFIQPTSLKNTIQFGLDTYSTWSYNYQYWRYFSEGGRMRYVVILLCIPLLFLSGIILSAFNSNIWKNQTLLLIMLCLIFPFMAIFMAYSSGHTISYALKYGIMAVPYFTLLLSYGYFTLFHLSKKKIVRNTLVSIGLIFLCNALVLKFSHLATFDSISIDRNELAKMNTKTQLILTKLNYPENKIIEIGTPWMALIFNFHLNPRHIEFKQKINPALKPNEIYISEGVTHEPLYLFPEGYNGNAAKYIK